MKSLHDAQTRAGLLITLLGAAILIAVSPFAMGLLGSAVLYVICVGPYRRLRKYLKPDVAATVVLVFTIIVLVLPLTWIVGLLVDQAPGTLRLAESGDLFNRLAALHVGRYAIGAEIAKASGTLLRWVSSQAFDFVGSAAHATLNMVISFFGLYYLLTSGESSWIAVREYIPFSSDRAEELRGRFYSVTRATLLGTALTALVQGTLIGIGFALTGLPSPVFWGVMTAIASVLPVLGSALVWLPGVAVLLLQQRYGAAIVLAILGAVLASNLDNLIRPLVYRRVSNIHPMVTLIGAFAGVKFFGLLGVLLGPLAIAYFFELLRLYRQEYGDEITASSAQGTRDAQLPAAG